MSIIYIDGFDDYDTSYIAAQGWAISQAPEIVLPGRIGGGCLKISSGATVCSVSRSITSTTEYVISLAFKLPSIPSSAVAMAQLLNGSTLLGNLACMSGGELAIRNSTTTLASTSGLGLSTGIWYYAEFYYKIGTSTGGYGLRINGDTVISSVSDANTGSTNPDTFRIAGPSNQIYYFDDLVISTGSTFLGDCRVITQFPDADGANTAWVGTTSIPTYSALGTADVGTVSASPAWPAHIPGDIALLFAESEAENAISLSVAAGFSAVANSPQSTGTTTTGTRLTAFWCRATSDSMATPTVTGASDHVSAFIVTFRNCTRNGTPYELTAGGVKTPTSTSLSASGVTTTIDNSLIVFAVTHAVDSTAAYFSSWSNANLGSLTEIRDSGTSSGHGGGCAVVTGTLATAGSSGTMSATLVGTSLDAYITIALSAPSVSTEWDLVTETYPDDDVSYISSSSSGDRETFGFPDLGVTGTVKAVAINHISRKDDAGDRRVVTSIRQGSTNYDNATTQTLSTSYAGQQQIYEQDPSTSTAWTVSGVDAGEFGIKLDT